MLAVPPPPSSDNRRVAAQVGQTAAIVAAAQFVKPGGPGFHPAVRHLGSVRLPEAVSLKVRRTVTLGRLRMFCFCLVLTVPNCDP